MKIQSINRNRIRDQETGSQSHFQVLGLIVNTPANSADNISELSGKLVFSRKLQAVTNKIHATRNIDEIMLQLSSDICALFEADRMTLYSVGADKTSISTRIKTGLGAFKDFKPTKSRMVHTWYAYPMESFLAVYAPKAGQFKSWGDFSGKPVFFTPAGFMNWLNFKRIYKALGYQFKHVQISEASQGDSLQAGTIVLRHSCSDLSAALSGAGTKHLLLDVFAFLDQRRLGTTVIHVVRPSFMPLSIAMTVEAKQGVNVTTLSGNIRKEIGRFLDPYAGWLDGEGWPFGRKVYRSELYQQIEGMEGVDHVETLLINGDPKGFAVDVGEFSLVCLSDLNVTVRQEILA